MERRTGSNQRNALEGFAAESSIDIEVVIEAEDHCNIEPLGKHCQGESTDSATSSGHSAGNLARTEAGTAGDCATRDWIKASRSPEVP